MLRYPARFEPDEKDGGYVVTFRDIPEAITQGDTLEEARSMGADALLTAMDFYFEDKRPVPAPSKVKKGEELIALPARVSAKVLLLNEMLAQDIAPSELARRMSTRPQDVNRIMDLGHATKIDTIATAVEALGRRLVVMLSNDCVRETLRESLSHDQRDVEIREREFENGEVTIAAYDPLTNGEYPGTRKSVRRDVGDGVDEHRILELVKQVRLEVMRRGLRAAASGASIRTSATRIGSNKT